MALNTQDPGSFAVGPDGSVTNTAPQAPSSSIPANESPGTVGGALGAFNSSILASLVAVLGLEGVITNTTLQAGTPTAAAGANNGASPPAPVVVATSIDSSGTITFGSGTGPAANAQVVVTFGVTTFASTPRVVVSPNNALTQALGLYVTSKSATGFTLSVANAPAASQANTIYSFDFLVRG